MSEQTPDVAGSILQVDLAAIVANWRHLSASHPSGPVAGVVKANAYGLGAQQVALALYNAGCRHFFVAVLHEALAIRTLVPDAMIGVLNGVMPGSGACYVTHGLTPVIGSVAELRAWRQTAGARESSIILHIDSGMHRLGFSPQDLATLRAEPALLDGIEVRYVMSHLVSSEVPDDPMNHQQLQHFKAAATGLPAAIRSFANSSGVFLGDDWGSDLARPGAALYGINPTPGRANPMARVVSLTARVLAIRQVPVGASVGYNATWRAARPTRIATAGIGYADGISRALSSRGRAFFDGRAIPLVGRVSMDMATFDITDHPGVAVGCWLEIIGPNQSPDDLADLCGTNAYEILTSLGHRPARIYKLA